MEWIGLPYRLGISPDRGEPYRGGGLILQMARPLKQEIRKINDDVGVRRIMRPYSYELF